jgi:LPXTG-site transpeptidase (sortase) family protein
VGWIAVGAVGIVVNAPASASAAPTASIRSVLTTTSTIQGPVRTRRSAVPPTTAAPPPVSSSVGAPVPVPPTLPLSNPSPRVLPGQESWVGIPSIGLDLPVFFGGQATIDRGVVTHYDGSGWRPPVGAGQAGTYWLAAHHVTHGAPFRNLPSVRPGDIVTITPVGGGPVVRYKITSIERVPVTVSFATVYGTDTTTARLLLQTCEGTASRLLVHGVEIQG